MGNQTETRTLPVRLSTEDLNRYSNRYSENERQIESLNSNLKKLKAENKDIALKMCTLEEERQVECIWSPSIDVPNEMSLRRNGSYEIVETREMTDEDRQSSFEMENTG